MTRLPGWNYIDELVLAERELVEAVMEWDSNSGAEFTLRLCDALDEMRRLRAARDDGTGR